MSDNGNGATGPTEWRQISGWVKMNDGAVHHVVTTTADRMGYSTMARRKDWRVMGQDDFDIELWQTFLFYHAMYRTGRYDGSFEQFWNDTAAVQPDDVGVSVDPTQPIASSG